MERLTFTVDGPSGEGLERVRDEAHVLAERLRHAVQRLGPGPEWELLEKLPVSLERLGEDPSAASVVREALRFYLASIEEVLASAQAREGYAALAKERGRARILRRATRRAAGRWADER